MHTNNIVFNNYKNVEIIHCTSGVSLPVHVHRCLCVGTILSGSVLFTCDGMQKRLEAGCSYVIPPNTAHAFKLVDNTPYSYITFCIHSLKTGFRKFSGYINKAVQLIDANENTDIIDLQAVCDFVNVSKFHFSREFKKSTGISPHQFIINRKIKKIRQGLLAGKPLPDLALETGFSDQSHLCRTFKKYMGISPVQYKKSYKNYA